MDWLFAWYNIIFILPLAFAGLIAVVQLSGLGGDVAGDVEHDVDHDVDHDAEHDTEHAHGHDHEGGHDHPNFAKLALSFFGIGRVPLSVVLITAALLFGGVGICANFLLVPIIGDGDIYGPTSLIAASMAMVFGTGAAARLIGRVMPKLESANVRKSDLVGQVGTTLFGVDASGGFLQVSDHEGNLHQVACRSENGAIPKGARVLLVQYEEPQDRYVVRQASGDAE